MIRLSDRWALPTSALLILAAVPVYLGALSETADTCRNPGALRAAGGLPQTHSVIDDPKREDDRVLGTLHVTQGQVRVKRRKLPPLEFRVVRSTRPSDFFFEIPSLYRFERWYAEDRTVRKTQETPAGPIPVSVRYDDRDVGMRRFSAYFFAIGDRAVASPLRASLSLALHRMARGLPPLTLFLVYGKGPVDTTEPAEKRALRWLGRAWDHYRKACHP